MKKLSLAAAAIVLLIASTGCNKAILVEETNLAKTTSTVTPSAAGVCDYDQSEGALLAAGWTKIFDEPFNGNLANWNIWNGGAFNNELQLYQAANLQVSNGVLSINAKKETVSGPTNPFDATPKSFNYTSGRIECKTNVSASAKNPKIRMAARIKIAPGYGMWPAFWSYGDPWPTQGEIDILEARGQEPFQYQTNYFFGRRANINLVSGAEGFVTSNVSLTDCWHVYEVIWEKNSLTFLLDGEVVKVNTGGYVSSLFGKTERVTLNLAVGGLFFSGFDPSQIVTGTMQVDWVKVFRAK